MYTVKVDRKLCVIICLSRHKNERTFMSAFKRYNEDFKQSLVNLYQIGKTQTELWRDYGVSSSALTKWIKPYSEVKLEDNTFMTAKQSPRLKKASILINYSSNNLTLRNLTKSGQRILLIFLLGTRNSSISVPLLTYSLKKSSLGNSVIKLMLSWP